MSVSVADIRVYPLNDMPVSDESDAAIQGAIDQATVYVNYIKRSDATTDEVDAAVRALGGYLAYLAYLDRPVQDVAGAMADGYFTPSTGTEGIPQIRSVSDSRAKERALYETAKTFINMIAKGDIVGGKLEKKYIPFMGLTSQKT
jgi:hypothetical protein